jgi:uncharacterized membrane protein YeaQ/YmgE (transglycosylase-associated protein family)
MMRIFKILLAAVAGSLCGAAARQLVKSRRRDGGETTELVIAASPAAIGAGLVAGLLFKNHGPVVAFFVAVNVGANVDPEVMAGLAQRFQSGGSTGS